MSPAFFPSIPLGLLAVGLLAAGSLVRGDDNTPVQDGYRKVQLPSGGYVLVKKEEGNPFRNIKSEASTDKYHPEALFSAENQMAHKQFSSPAASFSRAASFENQDSSGFQKKADLFTRGTLDENTKFSASDFNSRGATDPSFHKTFTGNSADLGSKSVASPAFADRGKSADVKARKISMFAAGDLATKTYLGPGAQKVAMTEVPENVVLSHLSDLPNRALTVDEVRELINHGVKPDTDRKPEAASKPLNDPDYKPGPLREMPGGSEDDKVDAIPSPGAIAQPPESSDPLPQR